MITTLMTLKIGAELTYMYKSGQPLLRDKTKLKKMLSKKASDLTGADPKVVAIINDDNDDDDDDKLLLIQNKTLQWRRY